MAACTMKLDDAYVNCVVRYRGVDALMRGFYTDLSRNNKKDTKFPNTELRRRLKETGFL